MQKKPSALLIIGIIIMPYIFSWATLRNGYSKKTRVISLVWMLIVLLFFAINTDDKKKAEDAASAHELTETQLESQEQMPNGEKGEFENSALEAMRKEKQENQRVIAHNKTRIDKRVYEHYEPINSPQVVEQFGGKLSEIQGLREQLAKKAIDTNVCEKVNMSEIQLDSDFDNPNFFLWCFNNGKEEQYYQTAEQIKRGQDILNKDQLGISEKEATLQCKDFIERNTNNLYEKKIHYIADSVFMKNTDGTAKSIIGVSGKNAFGVKMRLRAFCYFDANKSIVDFSLDPS